MLIALRCLCCGEPIEGEIALVTMTRHEVDRVFVAKPDHLERFDDDMTRTLLVTRTPRQ